MTVELHVARNLHKFGSGTQSGEPVSINRILSAHSGQQAESRAEKPAKPAVGGKLAGTEPGIHHDDGGTRPAGFTDQIGPNLGFNQDENPGAKLTHEASHGREDVKRQPSHRNVTERLPGKVTTAYGARRQEHRGLRKSPLKCRNKGSYGVDLAHTACMNPHRALHARGRQRRKTSTQGAMTPAESQPSAGKGRGATDKGVVNGILHIQ